MPASSTTRTPFSYNAGVNRETHIKGCFNGAALPISGTVVWPMTRPIFFHSGSFAAVDSLARLDVGTYELKIKDPFAEVVGFDIYLAAASGSGPRATNVVPIGDWDPLNKKLHFQFLINATGSVGDPTVANAAGKICYDITVLDRKVS